MTGHVFKGADSAAIYFDIDCCSGCDMADSVGLLQAYAVVIGVDFDRSDRLDGKTDAHIGRGNRALCYNAADDSLF